MILELDVGNSRIKWRVLDSAGGRVAGGVNARTGGAMFDGVPPAGIAATALERVRVSNVAGAEAESLIRAWCASVACAAPEFAVSVAEQAGVRNGYAEPRRLGVDRWLAVLAAWHRLKAPCCVVDCGSALTVDFLQGDGTHLGGLIAPGLLMMRNSLLRDTREIKLISDAQQWDASTLGGRSTDEAVFGGILGMAIGLIVGAVARFERNIGGEVKLLLTGGEAELIGEHLPMGAEFCPDLVLDGLAVAFP